MKKQIQVRPVFVKTKNVRNFEVMMDGLDMAAGEGRLGAVIGRAGRGKTRTSQWYHAQMGGVYMRAVTIWNTNPTDFLRTLCRELGIRVPPKRKGPAFEEAVDTLMADPKPVFIDEIEKLPASFLDLIRDISDLSTAPFILIGEEELAVAMKRNRRVWSRTYQYVDFQPIDVADVIIYAQKAAGLELKPDTASIFHQSSEGDFRIVRRDILSLAQIINSKGDTSSTITPDLAKTAVKAGLHG